MKRLIALLLVAVMVLGISSALAESWKCPNCGREGNKGQFCPDCGTKKPEQPTETPTKEPKKKEANFKAGDRVKFGQYEQNNNGNSLEDIVWIVLQVKDGNLFLLSEKGLDRHRFNNKSDGTIWDGCELRQWLNNDFLKAAFSKSERESILTTDVDDGPDHTNPAWDTAGRTGGVSQDKVFLLSYEEMSSLVETSDRLCEPSASVIKRGIYMEKHGGHQCCWYWLRTSAYKNNAGVVEPNGNFDTCYIHHDYGVVRPAIWVEASAVKKQ